jgi:hypothetical protein
LADAGLGAAVLFSVGAAAAAQVLSGMGFALVAGPLLILALGHTEGVRMSVAMSMVLNVAVLAGTWRYVRWGDTVRLCVPAAIAVIPATLLLEHLSTTWVSVTAGVAVLGGVALIASGRRASWVDGPLGPVAAGAGSGLLNVLAGVAGPPVALFVAHRSWRPKVSTATMQAYALPLNFATLVALGVPDEQPRHVLWAVVGVAGGAAAAWPFVDRIGTASVRRLVLALATIGAMSLIGAAFT